MYRVAYSLITVDGYCDFATPEEAAKFRARMDTCSIFFGRVLRDRPRSLLFQRDGFNKLAWLPKSQCICEWDGHGHVVAVPKWLVEEKPELTDPDLGMTEIEGDVIYETAKAWLLLDDDGEEIWVAKSRAEWEEQFFIDNPGRTAGIMKLPEWMLKKRQQPADDDDDC